MANLVAESGSLEGQVFPIDAGLTLGRAPHNAIPMPQNRKASRDHCKVWMQGPKSYSVADLGSTNGTLVNDERITRTSLEDGDRIQVGEVVFRFELAEADKPKPVVKPPSGRPDLAAILERGAPARPEAGGGSASEAASIEVKQRVLQYQKKRGRGSALGWDWEQLVGPVKRLFVLVVLGAAVGLFFLARDLAVSSRSGDTPPAPEAPLEPGD